MFAVQSHHDTRSGYYSSGEFDSDYGDDQFESDAGGLDE